MGDYKILLTSQNNNIDCECFPVVNHFFFLNKRLNRSSKLYIVWAWEERKFGISEISKCIYRLNILRSHSCYRLLNGISYLYYCWIYTDQYNMDMVCLMSQSNANKLNDVFNVKNVEAPLIFGIILFLYILFWHYNVLKCILWNV